MLNTLFATGAYGRQVSESDWQLGKDFKIMPYGTYFSVRDSERLKQDLYTEILFYNKDTKSPEFSVKL